MLILRRDSMKINNLGLELLKSFEGCRLKAYKLEGERYYTIGYGHSDSTIKKDTTITQAQADELLKSDLAKFEKYVTNYAVKKFSNLSDNQFSALVSYCYNRGLGGLKQLVNNSNSIYELGQNIPVYWGSNQNYKIALINRRNKEKQLFFRLSNGVVTTNVSRETSVYKLFNLVVPTPVLKRGSMGMQVEHLQRFLKLNNPCIKLTVDGIYGENTYKAVYKFQCANVGCGTPDGIYGKHTRDVVKSIIDKVR